MVIPQSFQRFLVAKDMFPRIFKELSKELQKHLPECPNFTEEEIGFLVFFMLRHKVILLNAGDEVDSVHKFTSRDSIAIQVFILKMRTELTNYYRNQRIKYSPFLIISDIFPYLSEQIHSELSTQIPERTYTKDELGVITLLLVIGVMINNCPCRMYFDEKFSPFDALIVGEFVSFYKNRLRNFRRESLVLETRNPLDKRS